MEIVQLWTMFCHLCSHKIISLCNENAGSMFARTMIIVLNEIRENKFNFKKLKNIR